ncbi:MAG: murein transglycosylase [Oscillatoriales cyanobacterium]|uniref:peptidoglycan lytic exotransglycosylase n=1 Tax=Microcoleus anatoxicus PTRS2 TaxID=2705321 RepID=A0ABU8YPW5_9CYAN|nr:MAG: murein transglycosylase [Oscillatoriales cyanobacterium]TAD97744.1 MAG: murein transglycosylase [Oscillatoriales cyanobacterium]TAE05311.1 MAG: murein transglycosylase [Oscillatoriales cyanobacterium]TAF03786.1 MAG: murein transglycosylase [Oscillatoriales cyanobacterium]TAF38139.1 MAG: murein transglycosylase [Oscillatoriales cyanobacterium]
MNKGRWKLSKIFRYQLLTIACCVLAIAFAVPVVAVPPLQPMSLTQLSPTESESIAFDAQIWGENGTPGDKALLLKSIDYSLGYLDSAAAANVYRRYPVAGITRDRVRRSLDRFRQLVVNSTTPSQLQESVKREFVFYKSIGKDGQGTVAFTGYFQPIYAASRTQTAEYRYPLYRVPPNIASWPKPHPTRLELEGADALQGSKGLLRGLELVWLRDRFQAFLIHVQGSAKLQLPDGDVMTVGFAGKTSHSYTGVGRELVKDGKFTLEQLNLPKLTEYFANFPEEMNKYLPKNQSFVFFRDTQGSPAIGSIGVPVTAERSIATDKSLMPPGALALISTKLPYPNAEGKLEQNKVNRYVLDQDTGGAIKGAGRVDVFMGTGNLAGDRAGFINSTGELYYPLLK